MGCLGSKEPKAAANTNSATTTKEPKTTKAADPAPADSGSKGKDNGAKSNDKKRTEEGASGESA
jgi:hypothetical protein